MSACKVVCTLSVCVTAIAVCAFLAYFICKMEMAGGVPIADSRSPIDINWNESA